MGCARRLQPLPLPVILPADSGPENRLAIKKQFMAAAGFYVPAVAQARACATDRLRNGMRTPRNFADKNRQGRTAGRAVPHPGPGQAIFYPSKTPGVIGSPG